jgi:hypothetical protein
MSNPVDKYLEKYAQHQARRTAVESLQAAGAHAAGLAGAVGLAMAASQVYRAITKKRDFNAMMAANPDLQDDLDRDPALFHRQYNALRSMQPRFAAEPIVAGTYMKRMSTSPEAAGGFLVEALQAAKGVGPNISFTLSDNPAVGVKFQ